MSNPIIESIALTIIAFIFLAGSVRKLADLGSFEQAIASYELTNDAITWSLSRLIPILELSAGSILLIPTMRETGALIAIGLLVFVTAAVVINLLRGRTELSCGCGGFEEDQPISWNLVLRNLTLIGLVGLAFLGKTETAFSWLDLVTIYASSLVGFGIFAISNQLSVNAIRLSNLSPARRDT
jgi:uncharacterized membrane protein YphA (DoxX/SURF4 family)